MAPLSSPVPLLIFRVLHLSNSESQWGLQYNCGFIYVTLEFHPFLPFVFWHYCSIHAHRRLLSLLEGWVLSHYLMSMAATRIIFALSETCLKRRYILQPSTDSRTMVYASLSFLIKSFLNKIFVCGGLKEFHLYHSHTFSINLTLYIIFLTDQAQFVLFKYSWIYALQLLLGGFTKGYTFTEDWLTLSSSYQFLIPHRQSTRVRVKLPSPFWDLILLDLAQVLCVLSQLLWLHM